MKSPKGRNSRTRKMLKADRKLTPADFIKEFKIGERVVIDPVPYYKQGEPPHRRYRGKVGVIIEKRGSSYVVALQDGSKTKKIISLPVHLKAAQ